MGGQGKLPGTETFTVREECTMDLDTRGGTPRETIPILRESG